MSYNEQELSDLIKSVEAEFSAHLTMAKSEGFPPKKEDESKEEPKDEMKEEGHKEESHDEGHDEASEDKGEEKHEEHSEEKPEHKEEGEKEEGESKHEEKPMSDEGHDYDEDDMKQMHSMYSSMQKGELKAHHDCIKKCLDSHKEGAEMAKSETAIIVPEVKVEEIALLKSEVEAEKAKATELKKSLDMVTELLTKMVKNTAPAAKAVTDLQVINKSEVTAPEVKALTKSEITAKLTQVASRPDLAKSDREAINAFYLSNNPNIENISHLLK